MNPRFSKLQVAIAILIIASLLCLALLLPAPVQKSTIDYSSDALLASTYMAFAQERIPLGEVLESISEKTGTTYVYKPDDFNMLAQVAVPTQEENLAVILYDISLQQQIVFLRIRKQIGIRHIAEGEHLIEPPLSLRKQAKAHGSEFLDNNTI